MSASSFQQILDTETRANISSDAPTASILSDPASSLRAAALLTLKSKRRKPLIDHSQPLPSRPPPSDTGFQLDYGQEEITPSPLVTISEGSSILSRLPTTKSTEDDQAREEGEISDEEALQPPTNPSFLSSSEQLLTPPVTNPETFRPLISPGATSLPMVEPSLPQPKLSERISDSPFSSLAEETTMLVDSPTVDDLPLRLIDANHVRPGLALNQSQYDTAKDIVLDLLGWGVPPEYLVDCGLTKEIVFYVFSELNLRLPQNLDITGILPYTPEVKGFVERSQSTSMLPLTQGPRRPSKGHSDFPTKSPHPESPPQTSQDSSFTTPSIDKTVTEATIHVPSSSNLNDIEQQRRQELLARKAVIASRKSKVPATIDVPFKAGPVLVATAEDSKPDSNIGHDVDMTVPTETVDDFLKSIEPKPESTPTPVQPTSLDSRVQRQVNGDEMDVDEIPGLGSSRSFQLSSSSTPGVEELADVPERYRDASPASSMTNSVSQFEYPPSSTESTKTSFNTSFPVVDSHLIENQNFQQRRGTKRPVASDFVDFETVPRHYSGFLNGTAVSGPVSRNAFGNGFASASGIRRCVIDLSDSEGEENAEVITGDMGGNNAKDRRGVRSFISLPARSTATSNRWTPPPASAITPGLSIAASTSNGTMSPAALMEKEIEIRRMRELIAQREQNRIKKIAAVRPITTIDSKGPLSTSKDSAPTPPKQEPESIPSPLNLDRNTQDMKNEPANSTQQLIQIASPSSSGTATIDTHNGDSISVDSTMSMGEPVLTAEERHEQVMKDSLIQADAKPTNGNEPPPSSPVDVDPASSSSAQVFPKTTSVHQRLDGNRGPLVASSSTRPEDQHNQDYATYNSLFRWYPLLGSRSQQLFPDNMTGLQASPLSSLSSSSTSPLISLTSDSSMFPASSLTSSTSPFPYSPSTHPSHISAFLVPNLKSLKLAMIFKKIDPLKRICQYEVPGGGVCRDEECDDIHLDRIGLGTNELEPDDEDTSNYLVNTLPTAWLDEHGLSHSKVTSALQQVRLKNPQMAFEERVVQALTTLGPPYSPAPALK